MLPALLERLAPLPTEVVEHSSTPPSPWAGYRRCLEDIPACSHLLVIQDDTQPSKNFARALKSIAKANPDTPVCLFLSRLPRDASIEAERAMRQNRRYVQLTLRSFMPVVAVLWPVAKAVEFREWANENKLPGVHGEARSDDAVGGRWKMVTRQAIKACVPSIVEHPDEAVSTIGRRAAWGQDKGRVACFIAEDAAAYDWSTP